MRAAQRGITLIGFIIVLAIAGFFMFLGAKLFPMYSEFYAVKSAMNQVRLTPGSASMSPENVWNILDKNFAVGYVSSVKRQHMSLVRKNGSFLRITYEVRRPLAYNLDIIAKFDHTVDLSRAAVD